MNARVLPAVWFANALLAMAALLLSIYIGYRYFGLIDCLAARDTADQVRTSAIAEATDAERAADLRLIQDRTEASRVAALEARASTDRVRAEHPAPPVRPCS